MRIRRGIGVSAIALLALAATAALASNFGPGGGIYYAQGKAHSFIYVSLDAFGAASDWARINELNPTAIDTGKTGDHAAADVAVYDGTYGDTGWCGIASCIDEATATVCSHFHVSFNQSNGIGCPNTYTEHQKRAIACHEFGHTVGLRHHFVAGTCMNYDWDIHYDGHDVAQINNKY